MSHYFINDDHLKSEEFEFYYYFNDFKFTFISDFGVFSKNKVDFGTNLLINSINIVDSKRVLDLGCGIGIIGITLAKANPKSSFHLVDVNLRALKLAKKNSEINKARNVEIYKSNLYEKIKGNFDLIISNPPIRAGKKVVHQIIEDGFNYLDNGGEICVVIQKKQGAPSMKQKMKDVFGNVAIISKKNGYYVLCSKKGTY